MNGYDASVLNSPETRLLVVGPNWLGDGIMSMPALQVLRERLHPEAVLDVAVKPGQAGLWAMHPAPGMVLTLPSATRALPEAARRLRERAYTGVFLLPNSFRSALAPRLAHIPWRRGTATQFRAWLLNDAVRPDVRPDRHQQWEAADLLLPTLPAELPLPGLRPPEDAVSRARDLLSPLPSPRLALIPGAARGPSKQWPAERFLHVARGWGKATGGGTVWLGTGADRTLCEAMRDQTGPGVSRSLAGETDLALFTALLGEVDAVAANDSGGMHLAAAVGTPVAAIFGITNPLKTGPLHPGAVVLQHSGTRDRAVARDSAAARAALEAVQAEEVLERVLAMWEPAG